VEGTIKCSAGRLLDSSHCTPEEGTTTVQVTKVFGVFDVEVTGNPNAASFAKGIAEALGVDEQYVAVFSDAFLFRRLSNERSAPLRFLSWRIQIDYEVVIKPDTSQSEVVKAAMLFSDSSSSVSQVFVTSMLDSGVTVASVAHVHYPIVVQSIVVLDQQGVIVMAGQDSSNPVAKAEEDSGVDVGFVVSGVFAGLTFLMCLGGTGGYMVFKRRAHQEAEEEGKPVFKLEADDHVMKPTLCRIKALAW